MLYIYFFKNYISVSQVHLKKKKQNLNVLPNSVLFISFWLLLVFIALHGVSLVAVRASLQWLLLLWSTGSRACESVCSVAQSYTTLSQPCGL